MSRGRALDSLDPGWRSRAACVGLGELFFGPEHEAPTVAARRVEQAREVCAGCPVQRECLETALEVKETAGVWAGHDMAHWRMKDRPKMAS